MQQNSYGRKSFDRLAGYRFLARGGLEFYLLGIAVVCVYHAGKTVPEKISGCIQSAVQIVYAVFDTGIVGSVCCYGARQAYDLFEQDVPFCRDVVCSQYQFGGLPSLWDDLCAGVCGINTALRAEGKEKFYADSEEQIRNGGGICDFPVVLVLPGDRYGQSVPVF